MDWERESKERLRKIKETCDTYAQDSQLASEAKKELIAGCVINAFKLLQEKEPTRPVSTTTPISPSYSIPATSGIPTIDSKIAACRQESQKARNPKLQAEFLNWCLADLPPSSQPPPPITINVGSSEGTFQTPIEGGWRERFKEKQRIEWEVGKGKQESQEAARLKAGRTALEAYQPSVQFKAASRKPEGREPLCLEIELLLIAGRTVPEVAAQAKVSPEFVEQVRLGMARELIVELLKAGRSVPEVAAQAKVSPEFVEQVRLEKMREEQSKAVQRIREETVKELPKTEPVREYMEQYPNKTVEDLLKEGYSVPKIAAEVGLSEYDIYRAKRELIEAGRLDDDLKPAIRTLLREGHTVPEIAAEVGSTAAYIQQIQADMTATEKEIEQLLKEGATVRYIVNTLGIPEPEVSAIKRRLQVRGELMEQGWMPLGAPGEPEEGETPILPQTALSPADYPSKTQFALALLKESSQRATPYSIAEVAQLAGMELQSVKRIIKQIEELQYAGVNIRDIKLRMEAPAGEYLDLIIRRQSVVVDASFLRFYSKQNLPLLCALFRRVTIPPMVVSKEAQFAGRVEVNCFKIAEFTPIEQNLVERIYQFYQVEFKYIFQNKDPPANKADVECLVAVTDPGYHYDALLMWDESFARFINKLRRYLRELRKKKRGEWYDNIIDRWVMQHPFGLLELQRLTHVTIKRSFKIVYDARRRYDNLIKLEYPKEAQDLSKLILFLTEKFHRIDELRQEAEECDEWLEARKLLKKKDGT